MSNKKESNTRKITHTVRIYDEQMLDYIDELLNAGFFASKNEIVNRAIEYGLPLVYKELFGKKIAGAGKSEIGVGTDIDEQLRKDLREIRLTLDDLFVVTNIIEYMTTTSFNLKLAEINGITVADDDVRSGIYSQLPRQLQEIKNEILQRKTKKRN